MLRPGTFGGAKLSYGAPRCNQFAGGRQRCRLQPAKRSSVSMSLIPFIPNWIAFPTYIYGVYKFYAGFESTSYQQSFRIPLSFAWPIFSIFSDKYRKNFMKALKGDDS